MTLYSPGFEDDHILRSAFIRELMLQQLREGALTRPLGGHRAAIPQTLVRYWHDARLLPADVRDCLDSWEALRADGFELHTFDDASATAYIAERYGEAERTAFRRCRHPAMRSDYFRLCFVLAQGGLYVDADDVLISDGWQVLFADSRLKLQPLCYDLDARAMLPSAEIWQPDQPTTGRIFYVNNNPIAAPPGHPLLRRALERSTRLLLGDDPRPEIQSTTGPGNLTAALAAHANDLRVVGALPDFELLRNWGEIAETRWDLSYRNDARNWRNMDA